MRDGVWTANGLIAEFRLLYAHPCLPEVYYVKTAAGDYYADGHELTWDTFNKAMRLVGSLVKGGNMRLLTPKELTKLTALVSVADQDLILSSFTAKDAIKVAEQLVSATKLLDKALFKLNKKFPEVECVWW